MSELIVVRLDPLLFVAFVFAFKGSALVLCFNLYIVSAM